MAGSTWKISYGDGSSASGTVVTDTLTVGGIKVNNQAIECAQKLSSSFIRGAGDGLMGLAMGNINTVKPQRVQTPVENMITQKNITNKLFTAYLGSWRDANEDDKGQSFYTFGYVDDEVLKHSNVTEPYYTPLVDPEQGFWKFASPSFTISGQSFTRSGNAAIADTGTTLALVADSVCDAIYRCIPGAYYDSVNQGYIFPTDTKEEHLPLVGFAVGSQGKVFTCGKEDLLFAETKPGWTYGGIQSRGDLPFDILGDTWLKGIYAVGALSYQGIPPFRGSILWFTLMLHALFRSLIRATCASDVCSESRSIRIWLLLSELVYLVSSLHVDLTDVFEGVRRVSTYPMIV